MVSDSVVQLPATFDESLTSTLQAAAQEPFHKFTGAIVDITSGQLASMLPLICMLLIFIADNRTQ